MSQLTRAVFDCNIYLQALSSPKGPSGQCVQFALDRRVQLFVSSFVLKELRAVAARPKVIAKLHLSVARVDEFIDAVEAAAIVLSGFPEPFVYPRDPTDAHYVNLAAAADAKLLVSRDNDLLSLMDMATPEGKDFRSQFPGLRIVQPVAFLNEVRGLPP